MESPANPVRFTLPIGVFKDAVDALETLGSMAAQAGGVPGARRKRYLQAVQDAYQLLNTAMNLVLVRLGDLSLEKKKGFLDGLAALDNIHEWLAIERQLKLCSSLRATHTELDTAILRMSFLRGRDWDKMRVLVDEVLEREGSLADFITKKLSSLSKRASKAAKSPEEYKRARQAVARVRATVAKERERLMRSETAFLDAMAGRSAG